MSNMLTRGEGNGIADERERRTISLSPQYYYQRNQFSFVIFKLYYVLFHPHKMDAPLFLDHVILFWDHYCYPYLSNPILLGGCGPVVINSVTLLGAYYQIFSVLFSPVNHHIGSGHKILRDCNFHVHEQSSQHY